MAPLLKTMNDLFLHRRKTHRTKTDSGGQGYRIWRDSIHIGRKISMVSVVRDRPEAGQVNQALNISFEKPLVGFFLS
jgi:hypothetical protein